MLAEDESQTLSSIHDLSCYDEDHCVSNYHHLEGITKKLCRIREVSGLF